MIIDPIKNTRKKVNPYLYSLSLVINRLRWDLTLDSFKSRRRMNALTNSHSGEKCVIVCNGPSLLKTNFDLLMNEDVFCIGLNKINLLYSRTQWRPDMICISNNLVLEQNKDYFDESTIPIVCDKVGRNILKRRDGLIFMHSTLQAKFARDMSMSFVQGYTVTYMAMQLAYHMGFTHVGLVGCDHSFATKGPSNAEVVSTEEDKSHFDPNYFGKGVNWHLPDLVGCEYYYNLALRNYLANERSLVNCTVGGKLDLLPRVSLAEFVKS